MCFQRGLKALHRSFATLDKSYLPIITQKDERVIKRIDIERKALITHQQEAYKEGKIEPMIHIIEKIQDAVKKNLTTPAEKLENAVKFVAEDSYNDFLQKFQEHYGNFAIDLYGNDKDLRSLAIESRGEIVPARIHVEQEMMEIRKYYIANLSAPGCIETINPNKFLRLKPIEEFPLLPIEPISPSVLKRYNDEIMGKKKEGYKFRIDKSRVISMSMMFTCFVIFIFLVFYLYRADEESWVRLERNRNKNRRSEYGLGA
ncbi:unnamed protein product [Blepharisma stoltei]|uniref:Uncharacterized protein n=1 Tax=Blepharisma stoltei TaxID=1481888 RepID=A0AAU9JZJ6_9CILI|nr:unnamed protein product [Blepharisma stoltei]